MTINGRLKIANTVVAPHHLSFPVKLMAKVTLPPAGLPISDDTHPVAVLLSRWYGEKVIRMDWRAMTGVLVPSATLMARSPLASAKSTMDIRSGDR